ncbi:MAG: DUF58 domain-containing protein [Gallionella sp.]|jgi:uncharacterized protein (DUF58 family)
MIPLLRRDKAHHPAHAASPDGSVIGDDSLADDGVVCVSLKSLIALHRAAESLPLKPGRIRALGAGDYHSPFKGRGMEFDEVRAYMQGDDVRSLDWRVTARTGRPHTKLFREERERPVLLFVDMRSAMFFATQGAFKAVRAVQAAALLGWSAVQQGERLGGLVFSEQSHIELRPRRGKPPLLHLLQKLASHPAWRNPGSASDAFAKDGLKSELVFNQALTRLRSVAQPGSLIVLMSDFIGLNEQSRAQLAQLARHNELMLIDFHDPMEKELPPPGQYRVSDGENFMTLFTTDDRLRERYRARFIQQQQELQQLCRRYRMKLLSLGTADDPLRALQQGLGVRL